NGIAIDLGNDRFRDLADHAVQVAHLQTWRPLFVIVAALATDFLITTGTEIALLAREHHHADAIVIPGIVECLHHFVDGARPKSIEHPRTVDTYGRHPVLLGVDDIFKMLHVPSPVVSTPAATPLICPLSPGLPHVCLWRGASHDRDRRSHH